MAIAATFDSKTYLPKDSSHETCIKNTFLLCKLFIIMCLKVDQGQALDTYCGNSVNSTGANLWPRWKFTHNSVLVGKRCAEDDITMFMIVLRPHKETVIEN